MKPIKRLSMNHEFKWSDRKQKELNATESSSSDESSSEEESQTSIGEAKQKQSKKEKILETLGTKFAQPKVFDMSAPEYQDMSTLEECQTLVLAHPDSSKAWLLYMVFHLKQAEVDKARSVAEKALKTISYRFESEKRNIWIALLNLENLYGTHSSLMTVFQQAIIHNEPKEIFCHLVDLFISSNKLDEALSLFEVMEKKFKDDKEMWIKRGLLHFQLDQKDLAREIMKKSLKSVDKKFYPDIMAQFAIMEYEYNDAEQGKTMFRNVLNNYPRRKDLLQLYCVLLKKFGDDKELETISTLIKSKRKYSDVV